MIYVYLAAHMRCASLHVLQGVLSAQDAERAVDAGVDGIVVSNHGGRQLDTALASLDALPAIAAAVGKRVPVLMDGGIRRGTDIIKVHAHLDTQPQCLNSHTQYR